MEQRSHRPPLIAWVLYNALAVPMLFVGMHLARFFHEKARAGIEGRQKLFERVRLRREELRGCLWLHATSAGEYEQARPILRALRKQMEEDGQRLPLLVTVFSPSGYSHASAISEADHVEYLPLDSVPAMEKLLNEVRPRAIAFVKYDCWPNLVWSADRRSIPCVLLGASLHERSQRLHPAARWFFRSVYDRLTTIGAIGEGDARRFCGDLAVPTDRVRVTGDSRVDQILHRFDASADAPLVRSVRTAPWRYIALGSTWPADESVVLEATLAALEANPEHGVLLVPHEPRAEHLTELERALDARSLPRARLSELIELRTGQRRATAAAKDPARWRCVVVDTVGVLAELYRAAEIAYVGGGFSSGVHSVVEPAACSLPVLFGPRHSNSVEAQALQVARGAIAVTDGPSYRAALHRWLEEDELRLQSGVRAGECVRSQSGATARSVTILLEALRQAEA